MSPQLAEFSKMFDSAMNQPWGLIIICFIFYFVTGYLLYASVFAAIGSAVDNETETQQFMLPVTIPIILGLMVAMGTMQNPESSLSFWCSMIPLTSPIVMMARIPFGGSILADSCFNGNNADNFLGICMDGSKSLPDRYPHVWKENLMERNVEMAEIQWLRQKDRHRAQSSDSGKRLKNT
jgi:cytochrome c oxidase assembly factor CtaG